VPDDEFTRRSPGGAASDSIGGAGGSGYLASERYDYDAYFEANPDALDPENEQHTRDTIKSSIFFSDLGQGSGQAGGSLYGIVGLALGAIYGLIDGIAYDSAINDAIDEARERRSDIESDLEGVMRFRADIENKLAQWATPIELAARENARLFAIQSAGQNLTGSQKIAAQLFAEQQYRQTVGPQLTRAIGEASREARSDALARLSAIEAKYGIQLSAERQSLLEIERVSTMKQAESSAVQQGIGAAGQAFGALFDQLIQSGGQSQQQTSQPFETAEGGVPDPQVNDASTAGAGDIHGTLPEDSAVV